MVAVVRIIKVVFGIVIIVVAVVVGFGIVIAVVVVFGIVIVVVCESPTLSIRTLIGVRVLDTVVVGTIIVLK